MPPIRFMSTTEGIFDVPSNTFTFAPPAAAQLNDTLLLVLVTSTIGGALPVLPAGFTSAGSVQAGSYTLNLVAHAVDGTESRSIAIPLSAVTTGQVGVLLHYRAIGVPMRAPGDAGYDLTAAAASGTVFSLPARATTRYSDLWLGFAAYAPGATASGLPSSADPDVPVPHFRYNTNGLSIVEYLAEVTPLVAAQPITLDASRSGLAASMTVAADALHGNGQDIFFDPPGAIGLPAIGV